MLLPTLGSPTIPTDKDIGVFYSLEGKLAKISVCQCKSTPEVCDTYILEKLLYNASSRYVFFGMKKYWVSFTNLHFQLFKIFKSCHNVTSISEEVLALEKHTSGVLGRSRDWVVNKKVKPDNTTVHVHCRIVTDQYHLEGGRSLPPGNFILHFGGRFI